MIINQTDESDKVELKKVGLSVKDRLKKVPTEEGDVAAALESLLEDTSTGKLGLAFIKLLDKYTGEKLQRWRQRRTLDANLADAIARHEPEDLFRRLPELFAADLNASLADHGQIALLFDSHEAFWGVGDRTLSDDSYFAKDEWLRCLLSHLDIEHGVVVVVAGRESPRWADAVLCPIPAEYLERHHVGPFQREDADCYLQRANVADAALRAAIIDQCAVPDEGYHPLYLGLCADIMLAAEKRGSPLTAEAFHGAPETDAQSKRLLNRLLRYVDQEVAAAVRALAACRAFDFEVFRDLGQRLDFHATHAAFKTLTHFSFVRRSGAGGQTRFRIHGLIRQVLHDREHEDTQNAHHALEAHYRKQADQGDTAAIAEALYHANRIRLDESVTEWGALFDQTLQVSRYGLCALLLEVRGDMRVETDFQRAWMAQSAGDYYQTLSRHENAAREYQNAIAAYAGALQRAPDYIYALNNQGNALQRLGDLQAGLSQHEAALASYQNAIAAYAGALQRAPDDIQVLNNQGLALQGLGALQAGNGQLDVACQVWQEALQCWERALELAPNKTGLRERYEELQCGYDEHCGRKAPEV